MFVVVIPNSLYILSYLQVVVNNFFIFLCYLSNATTLISYHVCHCLSTTFFIIMTTNHHSASCQCLYQCPMDEKKYVKNEFKGCFEIVSLTGTVNTKGGKYYSHLHISAGDESGRVFGGHLNEAHISATAEVVIRIINGEVDRFYDDATGLNLFKF